MLDRNIESPRLIKDFREIELGDIIFFKTRGDLLNKLIQKVQKLKLKPDADMVHVALCLDKASGGIPIIGHLMPSGFIIESILQKFRRQSIADQSYTVFRLAEIQELDSYRCFVAQEMENFNLRKVKYDKMGILHCLFSNRSFSAHPPSLKKAFCSSIIAKCLIQAKIPGFENYYPHVTPNKLYQDCKNNNLFLQFSHLAENSHEHKHKRRLGFHK